MSIPLVLIGIKGEIDHIVYLNLHPHLIESRAPSMTAKLDTGTYKITSVSEGDLPIGVDLTKLLLQHVHVDAPSHEV